MASFPTVDPCIYKSVTLAAGEQFNLPPGAVLVAATDESAISSTCPIPELEELKCYIIAAYASDEVGCGTGVWEGDANATISGITIAGTYYSLNVGSNDSGSFYMDQVVNWINSNPSYSGMLQNASYGRDWDGNCRGGVATLCFKTIPSIAENTYLHLNTSLVSPGNSGIDTRAYAMDYGSFSGSAKCGCS